MISLYLPFGIIVYSLLIGVFISIIYLWLLWLTAKSLNKVKHPLVLFLTSLIGRFALVFGLAFFFAEHNAARFLWIIVAFIISRFCIVSIVKSRRKNDSRS